LTGRNPATGWFNHFFDLVIGLITINLNKHTLFESGFRLQASYFCLAKSSQKQMARAPVLSTSVCTAPCDTRDFCGRLNRSSVTLQAKSESRRFALKSLRFSSGLTRHVAGHSLAGLISVVPPPLMASRAVVLFPGHPAGKVCSYKPFAFPPSMEVRTGRMSGIEAGMLNYRGLGKTVRRRGDFRRKRVILGVLLFGYFLGDKHQKVTRLQAEPDSNEEYLFTLPLCIR
jgi:hypothetical protein